MGKWEPGLEGSAIQQTGQPTSAGHIKQLLHERGGMGFLTLSGFSDSHLNRP